MKNTFDIDIFAEIGSKDQKRAGLMFLRRHVYGGGATVSGALQNLALTLGERAFVGVPGLGGERGIDDAQAGVNSPDGLGHLRRGALLQQVAGPRKGETAN